MKAQMKRSIKKIAVLTGGGDAPGLNAVIRAVTKTAINVYGCDVLGVRDGYDGFLSEGGVTPLDLSAVRGILPRGGTIPGTANRGNPFACQNHLPINKAVMVKSCSNPIITMEIKT